MKDIMSDATNSDCELCHGTHNIQCHSCHGEGSIVCDVCNGSGKHKCSDCDSEGKEDCSDCGGSGHESNLCPVCSYGMVIRTRWINCAYCHGTGVIGNHGKSCYECGGRGQVEDEYKIECPNCHGEYLREGPTCKTCHGSGKVRCTSCKGTHVVKCEKCNGKGRIRCKTCNGERHIPCKACVEREKQAEKLKEELASLVRQGKAGEVIITMYGAPIVVGMQAEISKMDMTHIASYLDYNPIKCPTVVIGTRDLYALKVHHSNGKLLYSNPPKNSCTWNPEVEELEGDTIVPSEDALVVVACPDPCKEEKACVQYKLTLNAPFEPKKLKLITRPLRYPVWKYDPIADKVWSDKYRKKAIIVGVMYDGVELRGDLTKEGCCAKKDLSNQEAWMVGEYAEKIEIEGDAYISISNISFLHVFKSLRLLKEQLDCKYSLLDFVGSAYGANVSLRKALFVKTKLDAWGAKSTISENTPIQHLKDGEAFEISSRVKPDR